MHRPAVTLIFTLMGEWQVRGNEIGMREEQRKAAWSVSPWRCWPLFLGGQPGTFPAQEGHSICGAWGPTCWHTSSSSAHFPSCVLCASGFRGRKGMACGNLLVLF